MFSGTPCIMNPYFLIFSVVSMVDEPPKKRNETAAQNKLTEQLNVLNESIASFVDLEKKIRLTTESKAHLKPLMGERNNREEGETV